MATAVQTITRTETISAYIPAGDTAAWKTALKPMAALVKRAKRANYCLPVLAAALLTPTDGGIDVSVTDLKIGHTVSLPGLLDAPVCVNVADLLALVSTGGDVYLDVDGTRAVGRTDTSTAILGTFAADEYPLVPAFPESIVSMVSGAILGDALRAVLPAASTDSTRGVLNTVMLTCGSGGWRFVTTDAYRLHLWERYDRAEDDITVLIPGTCAAYLARTITARMPTLTIALSPDQALLHIATPEGQRWCMTLLTEKYVNYGQILPRGHTTYASVNAKALSAAVKAVISKESGDPVQLLASGDTLLVCTKGTSVSVPCVTGADSADGIVSLNGDYLIDALAPLGKGDAIIATHPSSMTHAYTVTSVEPGYLAVIMPVIVPK